MIVCSRPIAPASQHLRLRKTPSIPSTSPAMNPSRWPGLIPALSDAAVLAGLYVTGAAAFCAQVSGLDVLMPTKLIGLAAGTVFCTTVAVYLLDRVKLRDPWLDPADAQSHPRRHTFVLHHTRLLRIACLLLLITAGSLGSLLMPLGWAIPLAAVAGVLVYAGRPRAARPRPKDILLVKNSYVAVGIAGFVALVTVAAATPAVTFAGMRDTVAANAVPLLIASAHLALRVLADAVLCDLDDEHADRRFNTRTLPVQVGRALAWNTAFSIRLGSAATLAALPVLPLWPRLGWAIVTVVSSILLRVAAPSRLRDWVDGRLAIEAALVGCALMWWRAR